LAVAGLCSIMLGYTDLCVIRMISPKHRKLVFSFFMALLMSGIMYFLISVFNVGMVANIMTLWLQAWSFAFVVALPAISILSLVLHKESN